MKKIAILTCLKAHSCCTGASCFTALNRRRDSFSPYEEEEVELLAFWTCNGCGHTVEGDSGLQEKIERLLKEGVEVLHLGVCTQMRSREDFRKRYECPTITEICWRFEERGVAIVRGTHRW